MKRGGWLKRKTPFKTGPRRLKKAPRSVVKVKNDLGQGTRRIWTPKKADDQFSLHIRNRDGRCMYPGCHVTDIKKLQCSHYHGRATKSTRFDEDNCIALCYYHHFRSKELGWEYKKQTVEKDGFDGEYTIFMQNWLGLDKYYELRLRASRSMQMDAAIIQCMKLLGAL